MGCLGGQKCESTVSLVEMALGCVVNMVRSAREGAQCCMQYSAFSTKLELWCIWKAVATLVAAWCGGLSAYEFVLKNLERIWRVCMFFFLERIPCDGPRKVAH